MIVFNKTKSSNADIPSIENQNYLNELKSFLHDEKTGKGLVNTMLRKLPLPEMHLKLPSNTQSEQVPNGSFNQKHTYSYCGPGTKVQKRMQEGYQGVNSLDRACKSHDIFYSQYPKTKDRNHADDILAKRASEIALDPNEPEYVRRDAKLVNSIMAGKSYLSFGVPKKKVKVQPRM
jgi:hypothetical protein